MDTSDKDYPEHRDAQVLHASFGIRLSPDYYRAVVYGDTKDKYITLRVLNTSMRVEYQTKIPLDGNIPYKGKQLQNVSYLEDALPILLRGCSFEEISECLLNVAHLFGTPYLTQVGDNQKIRRFVTVDKSNEHRDYSLWNKTGYRPIKDLPVYEMSQYMKADESYSRYESELNINVHICDPISDSSVESTVESFKFMYPASLNEIIEFLREEQDAQRSRAREAMAEREYHERMKQRSDMVSNRPRYDQNYDDRKDADQQSQEFWDNV